MKRLTANTLHQSLTLLAELTEDHGPQHWVVSGGSSLLALGLVSRSTTEDVDVLARLEGGSLVTARPLPDWLQKAAEQVGTRLGLAEDWLNTGPSDESLFRLGLPPGMVERLVTRIYGRHLCVSFLDRYDQIFFKLYASADSDQGRHYQDLLDLKPSAEDLLAAARWTLTQDDSDGFRFVLGEVLKSLGHENFIEQL